MAPRKPQTAEDRAAQQGLARAVEKLRLTGSLSREEVAKRAGLSGMTIAAIEEPTWGNLRRLAHGLGVELPTLNALAYELAPGPAGARLRHRDQAAMTKNHS
jgi:transcriptional regulator with XRE-family HTH domain